MVEPQQGKWTSCTGLPESSSSFTLGLFGESQQLNENEWKFADLPWVCPQFALKFCHTYFYWIFHPQGVTFWQFFAVRAHIRIFLAFRICINFYSILKIEPARPHLPPKNLGAFSGQEIVYIGHFLWIKTWHFLHFVNLWPEGVIRDHFTTLRAWKTIDQAFQRHLNFWPRSHCLSTQGRGIQCTKTLWWEEVYKKSDEY